MLIPETGIHHFKYIETLIVENRIRKPTFNYP